MTPNEYQEKAHSFALLPSGSPEALMYAAMEVLGEGAEAGSKIAKFIRKNNCFPSLKMGEDTETSVALKAKWQVLRDAVIPELGDIAWELAELCTQFGVKLEDVMASNIDKLTCRKSEGLIAGSGDSMEERRKNAELEKARECEVSTK